MNLTQFNHQQALMIMNELATREAAHEAELKAKDEMIRYYARMAELATNRKKQAIRNSERRAKLNFSYAALILAGMTLIPWLFWFIDFAAKEFWLWAN